MDIQGWETEGKAASKSYRGMTGISCGVSMGSYPWFKKCQELSDAVLNGDHDRAMELAYCYRGKKHELEKLEKAQDQGYYSKN